MAIIAIDSISKFYQHYKNTIIALDQVSLSVETQDIYGIIGLSGAGKSTLIRTLARLVVPTSGEIYFHGQPITRLEKQALRHYRHKIGMVFQHFNLLHSRTVAQNIAYPLEIIQTSTPQKQQRVEQLLNMVGLYHKKEAYPSQLSGGEKQRVGIARALATSPEILLSDEATSALDPKTTKEILTLFDTINKTLGITIILITHEMDVIKSICNRVAIMEKGKIVEQGLVTQVFGDPQHPTTQSFLQSASHSIPAEFFQLSSPTRQLWRLQFKGSATQQPVISMSIKKFDVNINILQGWMDRIQNLTIGSLLVEVTGTEEAIFKTSHYLQEQSIHVETLKNEC